MAVAVLIGVCQAVWIRIRMDPELLLGSGSGIKVPDPDPAKKERAYKYNCEFWTVCTIVQYSSIEYKMANNW